MRFDIDRYRATTARLDDADIDYGAFRDQPLDEDALRCLRYMHDVELHTVCYLRDLLCTPAHADPDITTFLTFWAYEEYWHGEALGRVLAAHDEPAGTRRLVATGRRRGLRERLGPLPALVSSGLTRHAGAVHMTWGALNEWTTQAGYLRLAQRAGHPVLADLLGRIARQEGRHIDFYAAQATERLADRPRAQRLTRFALDKLWRPVGSGVMPAAETRFLVRHLFTGDAGRALVERIDRRIDRLPGLAGLRPVSRAAVVYG